MTTTTRLRPTALAVALAAGLGLITGTAVATAVYASQPAPEPIVRTVVETVTVPDPCYVGVATDAVEAVKLSGRQGIVLEPDNGDAYAYRLAECGK